MTSAIVGLGNIATVHASVLNKLGIEVVDVCDVDLEKAKSFINEYNLKANVYLDYKELIKNTKADVIHITTPHYLHKDMIVECLKQDKNVLCEKPMCISNKETEEIKATLETSKGKLGICHQNRYNQASQALKSYLEDKKIKYATASLEWGRGEKYYLNSNWRGRKKTEGGSLLINQAYHTLDLLQWLVGVPNSLVGRVENLTHKGVINTEDIAMIKFFGDVDFGFSGSNMGAYDFPFSISILLEDKKVVRMIGNTLSIDGKQVELSENSVCYGKPCYGSGHESLIADFYSCVKENKDFSIDVFEGEKVLKMILATYKSKGKKVKI